VKLYKTHKLGGLDEVLRTTHNTAFCDSNAIFVDKPNMDGPHKDGKGKKSKLSEEFQLYIEFKHE
jgi:hypothetical protein